MEKDIISNTPEIKAQLNPQGKGAPLISLIFFSLKRKKIYLLTQITSIKKRIEAYISQTGSFLSIERWAWKSQLKTYLLSYMYVCLKMNWPRDLSVRSCMSLMQLIIYLDMSKSSMLSDPLSSEIAVYDRAWTLISWMKMVN